MSASASTPDKTDVAYAKALSFVIEAIRNEENYQTILKAAIESLKKMKEKKYAPIMLASLERALKSSESMAEQMKTIEKMIPAVVLTDFKKNATPDKIRDHIINQQLFSQLSNGFKKIPDLIPDYFQGQSDAGRLYELFINDKELIKLWQKTDPNILNLLSAPAQRIMRVHMPLEASSDNLSKISTQEATTLAETFKTIIAQSKKQIERENNVTKKLDDYSLAKKPKPVKIDIKNVLAHLKSTSPDTYNEIINLLEKTTIAAFEKKLKALFKTAISVDRDYLFIVHENPLSERSLSSFTQKIEKLNDPSKALTDSEKSILSLLAEANTGDFRVIAGIIKRAQDNANKFTNRDEIEKGSQIKRVETELEIILKQVLKTDSQINDTIAEFDRSLQKIKIADPFSSDNRQALIEYDNTLQHFKNEMSKYQQTILGLQKGQEAIVAHLHNPDLRDHFNAFMNRRGIVFAEKNMLDAGKKLQSKIEQTHRHLTKQKMVHDFVNDLQTSIKSIDSASKKLDLLKNEKGQRGHGFDEYVKYIAKMTSYIQKLKKEAQELHNIDIFPKKQYDLIDRDIANAETSMQKLHVNFQAILHQQNPQIQDVHSRDLPKKGPGESAYPKRTETIDNEKIVQKLLSQQVDLLYKKHQKLIDKQGKYKKENFKEKTTEQLLKYLNEWQESSQKIKNATPPSKQKEIDTIRQTINSLIQTTHAARPGVRH